MRPGAIVDGEHLGGDRGRPGATRRATSPRTTPIAALDAAGALLRPGLTGTNVMDIVIGVVWRAERLRDAASAAVRKSRPQHDAHIHPPERIRLDRHPPHPERIRARRCPAPGSPRRTKIRVESAAASALPKKTTSSPRSPEQPGRAAGEPGAPGTVQHLHRDPAIGRRNRVGVAGDTLALGRCQMEHERRHRGGEQRDQAGAEEPAARLFQKRTVGSGMGQPEVTRRESRIWATSRSTPAGSSGSRRASSARRSRSDARPGSR